MIADLSRSTVPVGAKVQYLGTHFLQVDAGTRLIGDATSSSDLSNYYRQLGDDAVLT